MTLPKWRKISFYFKMALFLVCQCKRPWRLVRLLMGKEALLELRCGLSLNLESPLEALVMAETILLDSYRARELHNPKLVVDIGAAFGDFTIWVKKLSPDCKVLSFEPLPEFFERLRFNLRLNNLDDSDSFNKAVGTPGQAQMSVADYGYCGASLKRILPGIGQRIVEIVGLDQFLVGRKVDLVKIDCEGAELDILNSISNEGFERIQNVALEYHEMYVPNQAAALIELLSQHNFVCEQLPDPFKPGLGYIFAKRKSQLTGGAFEYCH